MKTQVAVRWSNLHLPTDGLREVRKETDEHGYYADYSGRDMAGLWEKVSASFRQAGYLPTCSVIDDLVRGFAKGQDQLVAKIDAFGSLLALSIFDEHGKDPLLHGVCFGKYQVSKADGSADDLLQSWRVGTSGQATSP